VDNPFNYQVDERYTITKSPEPLPLVMAGTVGEFVGGLGSAVLRLYGTYKISQHVAPNHPYLMTFGILTGLFIIERTI
jgi:hypothetical protein